MSTSHGVGGRCRSTLGTHAGLGCPREPQSGGGECKAWGKGAGAEPLFQSHHLSFPPHTKQQGISRLQPFHWFQGSQTPTDFQRALTWSPTVPVLSTTVQHIIKQASGRSKASAVSQGLGAGWVSWVVHTLVLQLRTGTAKSLQGFLCHASCATKAWPQTIHCSFSGK